MPNLYSFLHHRIVDVSTLKILCSNWYPEVFEKRPEKKFTHRALDDIKESIEELKYYRQNMMKWLILTSRASHEYLKIAFDFQRNDWVFFHGHACMRQSLFEESIFKNVYEPWLLTALFVSRKQGYQFTNAVFVIFVLIIYFVLQSLVVGYRNMDQCWFACLNSFHVFFELVKFQ